MKTLRSFFSIVAFTMLGLSVRADLPSLLDVPDYLPAGTKQDLNSQHDVLEKRIAALRKWADDFNTKFGNRDFSEDNPLAKEALDQKAKLGNAVQDYTRDVLAFDDLILSHTRVGALGDCHGEFYLVTPDGRKIAGATGKSVSSGMRIVTGANGHVQVLLLDETVFTLGSDADTEIDDFVYDPNSTAGKFAAQVIKGVFRLVTGKVARAHPENMKVGLSVGSIGIRGTDFEVSVDPNGDGYVKLFSGKLEITKKKDGQKFNLDAGQMVTFSADGTWETPTVLDSVKPSI